MLISDIGLPDKSGLELIAALKGAKKFEGIALSGYGMEGDIKKSLDAGFAHHLTKPLDFQALEAILNRIQARR